MNILNQNILIVGSNSILSKPLTDILLLNNFVTIAYSSEKCGVLIENKKFKTVQLNNLFAQQKNYDVVIVISSFVPITINDDCVEALIDVNIKLIDKLTRKFANSFFIYCSSVSVYTPLSNEIISEKSNVSPQNQYSISKLWGEKIVQKHCINNAIVRISSMIGIGMKNNSFIPIIIDKALIEKKITLFGSGNRQQNYIDKTEVAKIIASIITLKKNGLFLAVGSKSYSNTEIAEIVNIKTNATITYSGTDASTSFIYDNSLTLNELNFTFDKSLEESIEEIIEWKKSQF